MSAALVASGLEKRYGRAQALAGADLRVEEGELLGLLGPNGAGKSTLVKIACGLVRPSAGSMEVLGARRSDRGAARDGLPGRAVSLPRLAERRRAADAAPAPCRLEGRRSRARGAARARGPGRRAAVKVEAMSKGMQQRLGIAQALVGSPRLLLLDEPTSALDPVGRRIVRDLLLELKRRGVAVLLNSHLLSEIELVCDRVAIMLNGRIVRHGVPAELARPRGVEVETASGTQVYEGLGRDDVPRILAELVEAGGQVYGARVLSSTLEDTYLEAVGER